MSDVGKNKGFFARLFGAQSSRCCGMEFEKDPAPEAKIEPDHAEKPTKEPVAVADSRDGAAGEDHVSAPT